MKPKREELDRQAIRGLDVAEAGEDPLAQLAQRQVAGVEHEVGLDPDRLEHRALELDGCGDATLVRQRVAMPRLREAPDQDVVAGLEEDDDGPDPPALQRPAHGPEGQRDITGADVEDDGGARVADGLRGDQVRQLAQQLAGQVVHHDVAQVLEQLGRRGLATARETGEDDDLLVRRWLAFLVHASPRSTTCRCDG